MSQEIPAATFQILVSTFATQAAVSLGQIDNPVTNKRETNLPQAKFAIDLLDILAAKTKDNLDKEEDEFLKGMLYQLRMLFLDLSAKGKKGK